VNERSEQLAALLASRENLYRFLARVYQKEIDQPFLDLLQSMDFPVDCRVAELSEGYQMLGGYLDNCGSDPLTVLAVDYAKVFLGAGISAGSAAFPYESVYTSPKRIMMQDARDRITAIYAANSLRKNSLATEIAEDHVALMLEFMAILCRETTSCQMQIDFLDQHLLNWVPAFCADIENHAETAFYKGIGKITSGYLRLDHALLESMIQ
jgi:TorA maturation chaperone TorD